MSANSSKMVENKQKNMAEIALSFVGTFGQHRPMYLINYFSFLQREWYLSHQRETKPSLCFPFLFLLLDWFFLAFSHSMNSTGEFYLIDDYYGFIRHC